MPHRRLLKAAGSDRSSQTVQSVRQWPPKSFVLRTSLHLQGVAIGDLPGEELGIPPRAQDNMALKHGVENKSENRGREAPQIPV
jgi:hypothetical protein